MKNTTNYTYDLLLKMYLIHTEKARHNALIRSAVMFVAGVGSFFVGFFNESLVSIVYIGVFFLGVSIMVLYSNRKTKIQQAVRKSIQENPNKINVYQFEDDCVIVNQTSDNIKANFSIEYSYITKVVKMDDFSFYFITKNFMFYVLYDENGIAELFSYVSSKTKQS